MKRIFLMLLVVCVAFAANAQSKKKKKKKKAPPPVEEPAPPVEEAPPVDAGWGAEAAPADTTPTVNPFEEQKPAEPIVKPYERIVLNFDSVTNLITYNGVVEQEESSSDSIYIRAKKWLAKEFGKEVRFEMDKKNQKILANLSMTAYSYQNKYSKRAIGKFNFKWAIWIKEGRYKYQISNLVHESEKPNQGVPHRNYFEYYYTTTTNIKGSDQILRYADKDLNELIERMKKALRDPVVIDEDEW